MKKICSKLTAALTAAAAATAMCQAFPASAAENTHIMGDLNGDFMVTAADAQIALNIYSESLVENDDNTVNPENGAADIDMNGEIDAIDAQKILLYYCQTLVGDQPMWAEYRDVSYVDQLVLRRDENDEPSDTIPYVLTGLYVEIGCAHGLPGQTVDVPVYVAGVEDLACAVFGIGVPEGLEPVNITTNIAEDFPTADPDSEIYYIRPDAGVLSWIRTEGIDISNGYTIGHFSYTIPEDAQSGEVYQLKMMSDKSTFNNQSVKSYQYTLLNGVVVVD